MPICSVVIRAYNEAQHIGRLLEGIRHQTLRDVEVILVDSGSTDATVAIAKRYGVKITHIQPQEFTFGRSLNYGIREATAPLIVIASAHVYPVYPDWLERLLEPFEDAQVALTYGKQRGHAVTKFSEHQIFRRWYPDQSVPRQPHPFCNNANAAIRRALWEQHPYDESLPALEDLAWARWAQAQGYAISYVAEAEVIHVHRENWRGVYNRYRREGLAFTQIYPHERFGLRDLVRLWLSIVWSDWRAARREGVWWREWWHVVRFRWAQFWGTYQGYRQSGPLTWALRQTFYYPQSTPPTVTAREVRRRDVAPIPYHEVEDWEV